MDSATGSRLPLLVRAGLLGAAAGGRTFSPPAALALSAVPGEPGPLAVLRDTRARWVIGALAVGELVGDTLPQTPSRLALLPLVGRALTGGGGGVVLATRASGVSPDRLPVEALVPAALVGASVALLAARAGVAWRSRAPFASDLPAALLEDAWVAGCCALAVR